MTEDYGSSELVGPGVYKMAGRIFVVKPIREKTKNYALELVEAKGPRINEEGQAISFDMVYAPGAIYNLREEDRMPIDEAKKLIVKYGKCIACGRKLKRAESVERGIGPICVKYFKMDVLQ